MVFYSMLLYSLVTFGIPAGRDQRWTLMCTLFDHGVYKGKGKLLP